MASYNVDIDDALKEWVKHRILDLHKSQGEYLEYLIRKDRKEVEAQQ